MSDLSDLILDDFSLFVVALTFLLDDVELLFESEFVELLLFELLDGMLEAESALALVLLVYHWKNINDIDRNRNYLMCIK